MLDWTTPHCRYFHRQLSRHAVLYTEMVTTGAILYGKDLKRFLGHEGDEPVVLQLGGGEPQALAQCAKLGEQWGYQAINLNVGCPSDRVQNNMIGACLMAHPQRVADCIKAMKDAVSIPVTIKTRIGIDDMDSFESFAAFCALQVAAGADELVIHARKAWLQGLSPKENRDIPPLKYDWVHQIKQAYPQMPIVLNGGLKDLVEACSHLKKEEEAPVDGVMLGRAVYENPYMLAKVDEVFYGDTYPVPSRFEVVERMLPYIESHLKKGGRLNHITRHMLGLFKGQHGGRKWRQHLSQHGHHPKAGIEVVIEALDKVRQANAAWEQRNVS